MLFFGPLTWASLLEGALDRQNAMIGRAVRGTGGVLLCGAWLYVIVNLVLLMSGQNVFCHGTRRWAAHTAPCSIPMGMLW